MRPRVLIYSSQLAGHRQLFCDVFVDVFLEFGYAVILAVGLSNGANRWRHIERHRSNPYVEIIDTQLLSTTKDGKLSVEQIVQIQSEQSVRVTLFPCGDELVHELTAIGNGDAPRLKGSNIGIFGVTEAWFPGEPIFRRGMTLWERIAVTRKMVPGQNTVATFFERVLLSKQVLDVVLVKDERVAEAKGSPFFWFPDIYRPLSWNEDATDSAEYDEIVPAYEVFLKDHSGMEPLLYFGVGARYKGYDTLLRLALEDEATCFIMCGTPIKTEPFIHDVNAMKQRLIEQGRFFDTKRQLDSWRAVDFFFSSIHRFVSTHKIYLSSGTMIQALEAGKPVLVPNRGLLRYRTVSNGVGQVYTPTRFEDLVAAWHEFKQEPTSNYSENIRNFMKRFSCNELFKAMRRVLL